LKILELGKGIEERKIFATKCDGGFRVGLGVG